MQSEISASTFIPSFSKRSALPDALVTARLPCLTTFAPPAAATREDIVDTLNVFLAEPPVPHVSRRISSFSGAGKLIAFFFKTEAKPASSSAVIPFISSDVRSEPI